MRIRTRLLTLTVLRFSACHAGIVDQFSKVGKLTGTSFGIPGRNATYDYVIVGGGTAGSVVAARLTEHSNASVAVIEAGTFYEFSNGNLSQIPFWSEQWIGGDPDDWQPLIDWGLVTEPQVNGRAVHYAQGKGLGGSSGRNQMLYHWPTKGSYQMWADRVDDESYTWDNMKRYLQRSINFSYYTRNDKSGPLDIAFPGYINPLSFHAPRALSAIGLERLPGLMNGDLGGYSRWHFTMDPVTGLRSSAETAFLSQAWTRPTLTVYLNAHARKVLFRDRAAIGVEVTINGKKPFTILARNEVIVSAGPYHSPQLLMVSGVGPEDVLSRLEIPIISALPGVGQNMWDSCYLAGPIYQVSVPGVSYWQAPARMADAETQLLSNGTGPLTNIGLDIAAWDLLSDRADLSADTRNALQAFPSDWPVFEYSISSTNRIFIEDSKDKHYGTVDCVLVATTARGNMTINSADNLHPPIINPNWLGSKVDRELAVKAYRRARQVWQAIPDYVRIGEEVFPGPQVTSDEEILHAIISNLKPIHHASSSCAMGKKGDPDAVVDSTGKVLGVDKLRVIDSSSFPFTPPGHTQAVTYAHAENLVEDVLSDWRASTERKNFHMDL